MSITECARGVLSEVLYADELVLNSKTFVGSEIGSENGRRLSAKNQCDGQWRYYKGWLV